MVVTGVEAQALFNWLINCRSAVSNTGPHAGIPPTLLAPVAFSGATLTPLKVRNTKLYNLLHLDFYFCFKPTKWYIRALVFLYLKTNKKHTFL